MGVVYGNFSVGGAVCGIDECAACDAAEKGAGRSTFLGEEDVAWQEQWNGEVERDYLALAMEWRSAKRFHGADNGMEKWKEIPCQG